MKTYPFDSIGHLKTPAQVSSYIAELEALIRKREAEIKSLSLKPSFADLCTYDYDAKIIHG